MDLNKLTLGDKIIAGSFLAFFIFLFLPWFSISVSGFDFGGSGDASGWDVDFLWSTLPFLLGLVMVAQIAIDRFTTVDLPELPVTWGQVHLGLGGLAALLVLLKLLIGESNDFVDISRAYGLFLATLAAIGLAAGGFFKMQEDDGSATAGPGASGPPQSF